MTWNNSNKGHNNLDIPLLQINKGIKFILIQNHHSRVIIIRTKIKSMNNYSKIYKKHKEINPISRVKFSMKIFLYEMLTNTKLMAANSLIK